MPLWETFRHIDLNSLTNKYSWLIVAPSVCSQVSYSSSTRSQGSALRKQDAVPREEDEAQTIQFKIDIITNTVSPDICISLPTEIADETLLRDCDEGHSSLCISN